MMKILKSSLNRQTGFTLIEMMLALALGLIVIGGMFGLFTINKETIRVQSALGLAQEEANFSLEVLAEDIRIAGWPGPYNVNSPSPVDSDPLTPGAQYSGIADTNNQYDAITVSRLSQTGEPINPSNLAAGTIIDLNCVGEPTLAGAQIVHRYYVDPATKELICQTLPTLGSVTIVDNVEAFQVLYGVDTEVGSIDCSGALNGNECMRPNQYVTGAQLPTTLAAIWDDIATAEPPIKATEPDLYAIKTIQLAILVNTDEQDIVDPDIATAQSYFLLNQSIGHGINGADFSNGQSRRMAIKTIALRNVMRGP